MKISIITAVYNNSATIEDCIKSVLEQSYPHIEYIVVDGNSTDGTKEIIEKYRSQISIYISEPDKGIYDALNKGLANASGNIVGLLHSDDVFDNNVTIENIAAEFAKKQANIIYGDLVYVNKNAPNEVFRYWKSADFKTYMLKKGWMPPHPTLFIDQKWIAEIGNYNTNFKIAADYDYILRLFAHPQAKPTYLPQIITRMRTGGASNRGIINIVKKSYEDYKILKRNKIGGIMSLFLKNISKLKQFL